MFSLLQSDALSSQLAERDSKIEQLETQLKQTKSEAETSSRKLQEAVRLVKHSVFSFHMTSHLQHVFTERRNHSKYYGASDAARNRRR